MDSGYFPPLASDGSSDLGISRAQINECELPQDDPNHHQCEYPSVCVDALAGYEFILMKNNFLGLQQISQFYNNHTHWLIFNNQTRKPSELSLPFPSESTCPGHASTYDYCTKNAQSTEGRQCCQYFKCYHPK